MLRDCTLPFALHERCEVPLPFALHERCIQVHQTQFLKVFEEEARRSC